MTLTAPVIASSTESRPRSASLVRATDLDDEGLEHLGAEPLGFDLSINVRIRFIAGGRYATAARRANAPSEAL
jgi:hypothetical protein